MTAFTPVNDTASPYHRMTFPMDPTSGAAYVVNPITGQALPHASKDLTTPEAKVAALHPQIRQNMDLLVQQQQRMAASQGGMPPASQLPPRVAPKVSAAAQDAKITPDPKAQKATASHSFTVKIRGREERVELEKSLTVHDAEGIAYVKKVKPSVWKDVEAIYKEQLTKNPSLLPKGAKIKSMGFTKYSDGICFEVHFMSDGVLERRSAALIDPELTAKVQTLKTSYQKILTDAKAPYRNRSVTLTPTDLSTFTPRSFSLDASQADPIALAVHQDAVDRANELTKTHSVHYTYPESAFVYEQTLQKLDPTYNVLQHLGTRALTELSTFELKPHSSETKDHEARILHNVPLRSGYHRQSLLPTIEAQELADKHPLHYCINASLGKLDKSLAPRTAHHRSVLISLERISALFTLFGKERFVKKVTSPVLLQEGFETPQLEGVDRPTQVVRLFHSIVDQALKYGSILKQYRGSEKPTVTIKDALCSAFPTSVEDQADVFHSTFVRMVAAIFVNSQPGRKGPKINLDFELPQELDISQSTYLHQMVDGWSQIITTDIQRNIANETPVCLMDCIEKLLEPVAESLDYLGSETDSFVSTVSRYSQEA